MRRGAEHRVKQREALSAYDAEVLAGSAPSYPSAREIALRTGKSRKGVYDALKRLKCRGLVEEIEPYRSGMPGMAGPAPSRWKVLTDG